MEGVLKWLLVAGRPLAAQAARAVLPSAVVALVRTLQSVELLDARGVRAVADALSASASKS